MALGAHLKAYVTSIGEPTTELCVWALERLGYEVVLYESSNSLAAKLYDIYHAADTDFLRVDADVIPNRNVLLLGAMDKTSVWVQGQTFSWHAQDLIYGGVQLIRKEAIPILRKEMPNHLEDERPESAMFRLPQFHEPRVCVSEELVCGLHGWGQTDQKRIRETKARRGQIDNYDWELVEMMGNL